MRKSFGARIRNKTAIIVMTAVTILGIGAAGTLAYLTDSEQQVNTFTVGDVKTELEEPNWHPENARNMVPFQVVPKDPQIENTGENPEIVFMKVTVPVRKVTKVEENGTKDPQGQKSQEIVYLQKSGTLQGTHENAFNTQTGDNGTWIELTDKETNTDYATVDATGSGTRTYVFAYNKRLAKGTKTSTLFDQIQLKSVIENEIASGTNCDVLVEAFAIQADNVMKNGTALNTSGEISAADLAYIYDAFVNQSGSNTGRSAAEGEKNLAGGANN